MGYYDLTASERKRMIERMERDISLDVSSRETGRIREYAADKDTYVRKNCYLILGRLYKTEEKMRDAILTVIESLSGEDDEKIRQTAVFSLGEIGKHDFTAVENGLAGFLNDNNPSVKNGLTGAIKQIGEKNPEPVIAWVRKTMKLCGSEMRIRILHGLELRGRTHPEEVLPVIRELAHGDTDKKTRKMLVHILGQISYKKGCLEKVTAELKTWENNALISECVKEILEVHKNYEKFSTMSFKEANEYLAGNLPVSSYMSDKDRR